MNRILSTFIILMGICLLTCTKKESKTDSPRDPISIAFEIENLSDQRYPDNPDIGFRSKDYNNELFNHGIMSSDGETFEWSFTFVADKKDTIALEKLDISELIPTIPEHVKSNQYLSYLSCINQEWNRNQVRFNDSEFKTTLSDVVRVDLARNCLNSYLWEVIIYVEEEGRTLPYSHGWFDFPHDLYAQLFEDKNGIPFAKYKASLEDWIDPESQKVELSVLRSIRDTLEGEFQDLSDEMYPLEAARKKKYKEIIYPTRFSTMRDLQSDSTLFATFSPPGFYDKQNPRTTELGRIKHLKDVNIFQVESKTKDQVLHEFQLLFEHENGTQTTLVIGGIDLDEFPVLSESEANKGWKNSMGIGNHSFYESYSDHMASQSKNSSYYAFLMDENGKWLDSHKIGIDGPIFHFSDEQKETLHLWLLSFERHALAGHYQIKTI